ncbi:MAG: hypothetical protein WBA54_10365 [Acidaminobacteraceae bacterium]
MTTQLLKREDLQQGDIILFSPYDDWESKLIAKMTNSKVTHSAMSYYTNYDIVEEIPPHVQVAALKDRVEERTIYVMRLDPPNPNMLPVLERAKKYVGDQAPYSKVNLVFVGLYMLIKKEFLSHTEQKLLTKLLKVITVDLIKLINHQVFGDKHPFVCSQFVFNCYYSAGDEYILRIKQASLSNSILRQIVGRSSMLLVRNRDLNNIKVLTEDFDVEKILESLYHETNQDEFKHANVEIQDELVNAVYDFSLAYHRAFVGELKASESPLQKMLEFEEIFVTPGDLQTNIENLLQLGILDNDEVRDK